MVIFFILKTFPPVAISFKTKTTKKKKVCVYLYEELNNFVFSTCTEVNLHFISLILKDLIHYPPAPISPLSPAPRIYVVILIAVTPSVICHSKCTHFIPYIINIDISFNVASVKQQNASKRGQERATTSPCVLKFNQMKILMKLMILKNIFILFYYYSNVIFLLFLFNINLFYSNDLK